MNTFPLSKFAPEQKDIVTQRDCPVVQIPYGNRLMLPQGTKLHVVQRLGDTLTVRNEHGFLLRVEAEDADALGLPMVPDFSPPSGPLTQEMLWDALRTCYDPEIPANIVELGLIYDCSFAPSSSDPSGFDVTVQMTLTAPGCGMGQVLQDDVQRKLAALPQVIKVMVELTFSPPWEPGMMSQAARLQLGMM